MSNACRCRVRSPCAPRRVWQAPGTLPGYPNGIVTVSTVSRGALSSATWLADIPRCLSTADLNAGLSDPVVTNVCTARGGRGSNIESTMHTAYDAGGDIESRDVQPIDARFFGFCCRCARAEAPIAADALQYAGGAALTAGVASDGGSLVGLVVLPLLIFLVIPAVMLWRWRSRPPNANQLLIEAAVARTGAEGGQNTESPNTTEEGVQMGKV